MALALSHFQSQDVTQALIQSLQDEDENVQLYALWSLGLLNAKEATPSVLNFLKSDNAQLRKMAAYILGTLGDARAISGLLPLLEDAIADVRWNAALSLARLHNDAGRKVLISMLDRQVLRINFELPEEEIEKVMINASKGLALIGPESTQNLLEKISREDQSLKVRQAALDALRFQPAHFSEKNPS
jgi:HEAT repeat protein